MADKSKSRAYFTEERTGFKIAPKTVLIMSLIYIGIVVLLHIYAKLGSSKPVTIETPTDSGRPEPASAGPSGAGEGAESVETPEAEGAEPDDL